VDAEELAQRAAARFPDARVETSFGEACLDVPAPDWVAALAYARDELGCTYFDWLSAVDELAEGFAVVAHVWALPAQRLLLRTRVPSQAPRLDTATGIFRGASWHERETREMFGIEFAGHPDPAPLLLPEGFEGHPLRKSFVLAARAAKAWPGAKEPGESDADVHTASPGRRKTLPPGVPDPSWGPRPPAGAAGG
jgi:NADH-quinone oxidoreductase subunit C